MSRKIKMIVSVILCAITVTTMVVPCFAGSCDDMINRIWNATFSTTAAKNALSGSTINGKYLASRGYISSQYTTGDCGKALDAYISYMSSEFASGKAYYDLCNVFIDIKNQIDAELKKQTIIDRALMLVSRSKRSLVFSHIEGKIEDKIDRGLTGLMKAAANEALKALGNYYVIK